MIFQATSNLFTTPVFVVISKNFGIFLCLGHTLFMGYFVHKGGKFLIEPNTPRGSLKPFVETVTDDAEEDSPQ